MEQTGSLHHVELWVPDLARASAQWGWLNHLAFHAGTRGDVDKLAGEAPAHGWTLLFPEKHPFAGGPEHYAAYLSNSDGFEVELVAGED